MPVAVGVFIVETDEDDLLDGLRLGDEGVHGLDGYPKDRAARVLIEGKAIDVKPLASARPSDDR